MINAKEALQRLREGNHRYVQDTQSTDGLSDLARRKALVSGQEPFAIILGCSDSRVPAEIVFDQGLGDLFVIRVAGNIVAPSQIGSVEFAAEQFGTPLVVVMGHTCCGAVKATLDELSHPQETRSPNLRSIVDRIRPAVQSLMHTDLVKDPEKLMHKAVRANVRVSVHQLQNGSAILEKRVQEGKLRIVGAEYDLRTGVVDFFENADD